MSDGLPSFIICSIISISPGRVGGFPFPPHPYSKVITHHQSVQEHVRGLTRQPGLRLIFSGETRLRLTSLR